MGSQNHRSLRVFKTLTPPAAFNKADVNSYVAFTDPQADTVDPYDGSTKVAPPSKCQSITISVDTSGGSVDYSFDGTTVHGTLKDTDGLTRFPGIRETEIYFRSSGAATCRFWAW